LFIPEAVARYRGISPGAKVAYGRLCRYAGENGEAHPSFKALANEVGASETQARLYVRELVRGGFMECAVRLDPDGRQTSNRYFFLWHPAFDGAAGKARKKPPSGVRKTAGGRVRKTAPEENHHQENHHQESHHQESQKEESQAKTPEAIVELRAAVSAAMLLHDSVKKQKKLL
jgi:Helix-turn-helix domain